MKKLIVLTVAALALLCFTDANAQIVRGSSSVSSLSSSQKSRKSPLTGVRYQGEYNFGYATGGQLKFADGDKEKTDFSRPYIETVHGVRMLNDYLFVGAGLGFQYAYGKVYTDPDYYDSSLTWDTVAIPLFVNFKGYYPLSNGFAPYISWSIGGSIFATSGLDDPEFDEKLKGGLYTTFGAGFNYRKFNFGFGLMHQGMKMVDTEDGEVYDKSSVNSFYVQLGFKF